jgi:hypothetical protein
MGTEDSVSACDNIALGTIWKRKKNLRKRRPTKKAQERAGIEREGLRMRCLDVNE